MRDDRPRIGLNRSEIVAVHGAPPNLERFPRVQPTFGSGTAAAQASGRPHAITGLVNQAQHEPESISVPQQSTGTRRQPHQYMIMPPSTLMACPVMLAASSDAR